MTKQRNTGRKSNGGLPSTGGRSKPVSRNADAGTQNVPASSFNHAATVADALRAMSPKAAEIYGWLIRTGSLAQMDAPYLTSVDLKQMGTDIGVLPAQLLTIFEEISQWVVPATEAGLLMRSLVPLGWKLDDDGQVIACVVYVVPVTLPEGTP